ncbi:hypothetical protein CC2G_006185 [Coprinopsis cinerea AmutBmut pab1-1]|nr:hypothetical protein CC2G_006185 [Coprinopsis cinerea AmutBmut pab1-1]
MEHQLNPATKAFLVTESKRYSTLHEDYRGTISLVEILLDRVDRFETFAFRGALVKRTMTHIVQLYDDQAEINSIPGYHVVLPKDLQRRIYTFARLLLFVGLPHLPGNGVEQLKKAFGLVTESCSRSLRE